MVYKNAKLAAYMMVGVIAFSGSSIRAEATGVSSLLPAAGLALTLEEGSEQKEVKASTKSAEESEKKEEIVTSLKKDTESKDKKSDAGTSSTEKADDTKKTDGKKADTKSSVLDGIKDENSKIEIKNSLEPSKEEEKKEEKKPLLIEDKEVIVKDADTAKAAKVVEDEKLTEEEKEFSKLVIAKVNDYVNVRSGPGEDTEIIGKLYDESVGDFISEKDGWYRIKSGNVTGFVKAEYCVTGEEAIALAKEVGTRVATVTTTTLKVRESAGLDAPVLGLVPIEEELTVIEELDGWVKVDIEEGYGYVSSDYVELRTDFVKAESKEEERARLKKEEDARKAAREAARKAEEKIASERAKAQEQAEQAQAGEQQTPPPVISSDSSLGQAVVDYAMQFVGNPYVYGGTSLTNGADCSGFVMSVYKNFGVSLPHSSYADRTQGYAVDGLENAQPGDLVCYSGHVGIYAGGGKLVHASTSKTGIIVSNANYRKPLAVRRIF